MKNRMTLPFGVTQSLQENGIRTRHRILVLQGISARLDYIRWKISQGRPLILLNETEEGIQHYFTVLGYSGERFFLYDSLQVLPDDSESRITIDDNGELPGNRTYMSEELLEHWGGGGMGPFRWYLIETWIR